MKGPSSPDTNRRTESVSDTGCQTDWKTTSQPSQGAAGGNVWSNNFSSRNQASSSSSSSESLIEKLFDEEKNKKCWEFKWKWFVIVTLCLVILILKVYKSYMRSKFFLFNIRKRRQQGSHKIFQYWKSRDVCKEIILLPSIGVSKLWFYHISSKYSHYPLQLPSHYTVLNRDGLDIRQVSPLHGEQ